MTDPLSLVVSALPSALAAGVLAIAVTASIERWGGTLGGLLGTLPTTIVPASVGIALSVQAGADDASRFVQAMSVVPGGMLINAVFLVVWRVLPPRVSVESGKKKLGVLVGASLAVWLVGAVMLVVLAAWLRGLGMSPYVVALGGFGALVGIGVAACLRRPPSPKGSRPVSWRMHLVRGSMAAVAIGTSVVIAKLGGEVAAGVASVFPAIFLTSMVALWVSQGEDVQGGAVGPMMLGSSSVAAYAVLACVTYPALGVVFGAVVAWVGAVLTTTLPSWCVLQRLRASEPS